MKLFRYVLSFAGLLAAACNCPEPTTCLVPVPAEIRPGRGAFDLSAGVGIGTADSLLLPAVDYLSQALSEAGVNLLPADEHPGIGLSLDSSLAPQAYRLSVAPDGIVLCGGSYEGVISAAATLQQLLWQNPERLGAVEIADEPRFRWRGAMLDVSRHFFTMDEVRSLVDRMALYKFNRLHLHLTDDQGWRLEIGRYPLLTRSGAWRTPDRNDSVCFERAARDRDDKFLLPADRVRETDGRTLYGGFYTQDEIRELIAYAAQRGIEIVPEIDLPGHSLAAIGAYPVLACDGRGAWGENFSTPLCLGNEFTLEFCRNVLGEVFELFPSPYIHIGGDEVERTAWETCPRCRARAEGEHLGGIEGLQPWFTRELERFCLAHGKTPIGWDEITNHGIRTESMVMWWRSWAPGTLNDALQQGHRVILSPSEYLYLSEDQDRNSLAKVYGWEPVPGNLPSCDRLIEGIQGNLWAEHAPSKAVLGERLFPRLLAVAEIAWSRAEKRNFADFERRLPRHLEQLGRSGWNYRMKDVEGVSDRNVFLDRAEVRLVPPAGATLHYTLDGSVPDTASAQYAGPFAIDRDCMLTMRCYNAQGIPGELTRATFERTEYQAAVADAGNLTGGLLVRWYDFRGECCADIDKAPLKANFISDEVCVPDDVVGNVGLIFEGYVRIPEDGIYSFYTYSDDGSILVVGDRTVVDNDGLHSRTERSGQAALRKGLHKFSLRYFDSNGGVLEAGTIDPAGVRHPFGAELLAH